MKRCAWFIAVLVLLPLLAARGSSSPATTEPGSINFPDANLEKAIRDALGEPPVTTATTTPPPPPTTTTTPPTTTTTPPTTTTTPPTATTTPPVTTTPTAPPPGPTEIGQPLPHLDYWEWHDCLECHENGGLYPFQLGSPIMLEAAKIPSDHSGIDNAVCITCHYPPT